MSKKLERLLEKERQLKAQIQQAKAAERSRERKKETRRKFLIGAAISSQVKAGDFSEQVLLTIMDDFLTRPDERALFGLSASNPSEQKQKADQTAAAVEKRSTPKKKRTTRKPRAANKKNPTKKKV